MDGVIDAANEDSNSKPNQSELLGHEVTHENTYDTEDYMRIPAFRYDGGGGNGSG